MRTGAAISATAASPATSRDRIARLVGSASAAKTASMFWLLAVEPLSSITLWLHTSSVRSTLQPHRHEDRDWSYSLGRSALGRAKYELRSLYNGKTLLMNVHPFYSRRRIGQ